MSKSPCLAVAGKGGVGKTTLSAFLIRSLLESGHTPILAVDADPSACLAGVLGVNAVDTIGGIREDTRAAAGGMPEGIPKQQYLELKIQEAITEARGFDLLTMGRPEGPGCYCFVNNLLRDNLDRLTRGYQVTVIDCEAGLEHISRRTSRNVDTMILVADPTLKALETIATALQIAETLDNKTERFLLLLNRVPPGRDEDVVRAAAKILDLSCFEAMGIIPQDDGIFEAELAGQNVFDIRADSPSYQHFLSFLSTLKNPLIT
jgi:CO dehydrogenase maturation factor